MISVTKDSSSKYRRRTRNNRGRRHSRPKSRPKTLSWIILRKLKSRGSDDDKKWKRKSRRRSTRRRKIRRRARMWMSTLRPWWISAGSRTSCSKITLSPRMWSCASACARGRFSRRSSLTEKSIPWAALIPPFAFTHPNLRWTGSRNISIILISPLTTHSMKMKRRQPYTSTHFVHRWKAFSTEASSPASRTARPGPEKLIQWLEWRTILSTICSIW